MHEMLCPRCGKLLGKTWARQAVTVLLLWCRNCKREVEPVIGDSC